MGICDSKSHQQTNKHINGVVTNNGTVNPHQQPQPQQQSQSQSKRAIEETGKEDNIEILYQENAQTSDKNQTNSFKVSMPLKHIPSNTVDAAEGKVAPDVDEYKSDELLARADPESIFSSNAVRMAYQFWNDNVMSIPEHRKQEIGVALYAQMFRSMPECRKMFLQGDIDKTAKKFLWMIEWLIMELHSKNGRKNMWSTVRVLGQKHREAGVQFDNFLPMLQAFHSTFQELFKDSYSMRVKFCIESLFMNSAKIMTEKDFKSLFGDRVRDLQTLDFLESLDACLAHPTGREYLDRYLNQSFCGEYVTFLKAYDQYKQMGNNAQRYEKARDIYFTNLHSNAPSLIEVTIENIQALVQKLQAYETALDKNEMFQLERDLLDSLYNDVKQLLCEQSWHNFQKDIRMIKSATLLETERMQLS